MRAGVCGSVLGVGAMATVINTSNPLPSPDELARRYGQSSRSHRGQGEAPTTTSEQHYNPEEDVMDVEEGEASEVAQKRSSSAREQQDALESDDMDVLEEESRLKFEFEFMFPPALQREVFTNPLQLRGWNDEGVYRGEE